MVAVRWGSVCGEMGRGVWVKLRWWGCVGEMGKTGWPRGPAAVEGGWEVACCVGVISSRSATTCEVVPVLSAVTNHKIWIKRGVKQGCPLSPFLFILCFELLLRKLRSIGGPKRFAFADDLAILTSSLHCSFRA